ncbi:hypothetical protein F8154_00460 [Alkaliphilus pronyensis]|uniref:DUF8042 domain-containing protein n=1 Tax=Alkaliphilus pronyensis TaxID=1482732 RepID=A0A6I0FLU0_9FIRM|nr:hypothetical protein [Alkaliphilus pronyensis]KAB3539659.1 hypothetical protein F8154_00460 [Alkaliphilus pronyensis]
MEKYYEVIRRIIELIDTLEEGIIHLEKQLTEHRYEESVVMLQDLLEAISSIANAIEPMDGELPENNISSLSQNLIKGIQKTVDSYSEDKEVNLSVEAQEYIIPNYISWRDEIAKTLKPYIQS